MNIQTEHRDDHTARMVVEFETQKLEKAKQTAAQRISKKINIPGFRKGKAPYRVIAKFVGEEAIVEDAVEIITNDIYREALDESKLDPYGPGSLEEYHVEPTPTFTFSVPLQPTVDLKDYRAVRLEYTAPEITDEQVDQVMKQLQMQHAVIEESSRPAAMGDRVTLDIHSVIELEDEDGEDKSDENVETEATSEHESDENAEAETEADGEHEDEHEHGHDDVSFIHGHDQGFMLEPEEDPIPGFSEAIVDANTGDTLVFELILPDDDEHYPGKTVKFDVNVKKIENVTRPPLNDDLAERVTAEEEKPLTLLELRMRVRENMQRDLEKSTAEDYGNRVLDAMVEQAEIKYPEAMVMDQVQQLLQRLDENLRQNRLTLIDYLQIYRRSINDLVAEYRPTAENVVRRGLVMREVGLAEQIDVSDADLGARLEEMVDVVKEEEKAQARELITNDMMRDSVRENMMRDNVMERLAAIARGEAPELGTQTTPEESVETSPEPGSSDEETSAEVSDAAPQSSEQEA
ncbi:MAG: trigger factor [Anaerolineae bacterium]|nr:trigger factor [Anaerolineae bacterium]